MPRSRAGLLAAAVAVSLLISMLGEPRVARAQGGGFAPALSDWDAPSAIRVAKATGQPTDSSAPEPSSSPGSPIPTPQKILQAASPPAQSPSLPKPRKPKLFEVHGSLFERYRDDTNRDNGSSSAKGSVTYAAITGTANVRPDLSAYVRFGSEQITPGGRGRDYNSNYYKGMTGINGPAALDQFGLVYHNVRQGLSITAGRQDEPLDATGTMYDQSWRVGLHVFLDGIAIVKTIGTGNLQLYAFSEDQWYASAARNAIYAIRGIAVARRGLTFGFTGAHYQPSAQARGAGIEPTYNYEGDVEYKAANSRYVAEYGRSSAGARNDLYYLGAKYGYTPRDSVTVFTYKIADNADVGHDSAYPNGNRGTRYFDEHYFGKRLEVIVYYETDRRLYGPGKSDSFQTTLQWSF